MHSHTHDTQHPAYLVKIAAAIEETNQQHREAMAMLRGTDAEHAARAARLALTCARAGAWWALLVREITHDHRVHRLFLSAAITAEVREKGRARFWREAAADWRARAEHRPTSDAAGALSNWHELGVTA